MTLTSLELQVGLVGGADAAALELAEELREVLLPDVEIDAVDEGHGGLGVPQDERGREDVENLFLQPGRPVAVAETRHVLGLEALAGPRWLIESLRQPLPFLGGNAAPEFAPRLRIERIVEVRDVARALGCREDDAVVRGADPVNELGGCGALAGGVDPDASEPLRADLFEVFAGT